MRIKITTNARMVRKGLENLAAALPKIGRQTMYDALFRAQKKLKRPGKPIAYPVKWDSIRQRKKVMAMLREQNNLPYKRTGAYQKGYRIRALKNGHELSNPLPHAQYIGGNARGGRQSSIHQGRWPLMRDVLDKELARLPSAIVSHMKVVARQKGFKTR